MKQILFDSDILIEVGRGRSAGIVAEWRRLEGDEETLLATTPVSVAEVWRGALASEQQTVAGIFNVVRCVSLEQHHGELAGQLMRHFAPSHGLELPDALIAAVAIGDGYWLWTRNRKHFPMRDA